MANSVELLKVKKLMTDCAKSIPEPGAVETVTTVLSREGAEVRRLNVGQEAITSVPRAIVTFEE